VRSPLGFVRNFYLLFVGICSTVYTFCIRYADATAPTGKAGCLTWARYFRNNWLLVQL